MTTSSMSPRFAERTQGMSASAIREILKVVARPDIISFAGGMPAPELFPTEDFAAAAQAALAEPNGALASLQYGFSEGYSPLRQLVHEGLEAEGIDAPVSQILITTGSQQAVDMVAKLFIDPGDVVVVENPTFLGALQSFNSYQATYATVPMDDEGLDLAALEAAFQQHRPKLLYVITSFQNPTGASMSEARKAEVFALCERYDVLILEDDPYGDLYYEGARPSTLKALDTKGDRVLLMRTFSKVLAPGLRVGYLVFHEDLMKKMMPIKQSADLHTPGFNQVAIAEYIKAGHLERHLRLLRETYGHRRDVMLAAMAREFPASCTWTRPGGGMFIWVTLPEGISTAELLAEAVESKVAFIPGKPFYALGGGENTFRLNFSNASDAQIEEGIARLGAVLRRYLER